MRTSVAATIAARITRAIALAALGAALVACAPSRPVPPHAAAFPPIAPARTAELAIPGRALLLPAIVDAAALGAPDTPIEVRAALDRGASIPVALHRVEWSPLDPSSRDWLDRAPALTVSPVLSAHDARPAPNAEILFSIVLPPDAAGSAIAVNAVPVALTWVDAPPARLPRPRTAAPAPVGLAQLLHSIEPAAADPLRRWRARLLFDRLAQRGIDPGEGAALAHPVLEMLARQVEDRWRIALARLHHADAALHDEALDTLTAVVAFDGGRTLPLWRDDAASLAPALPEQPGSSQELLEALLDPSPTPARLVERARAWLREQPRALAWIEDDAGDTTSIRVGVVNRSSSPVAVAITAEDAGDSATRQVEMAPLGPWQARSVAVRAPTGVASPRITARIGSETIALPGAMRALPAAPPGLRIDHCFAPRSMLTLLAGIDIVAPADRATAGLLQRRPADQPLPEGDSRWELALECIAPTSYRSPAGISGDAAPGADNAGGADFVRVCLGPTAAPRAILRVDHRGFVVEESAPLGAAGARARPAVVTRLPDRWLAAIPIPQSALEPDGSLLLGLERIVGAERFTWPRPVFAWEPAPPRLRADLSAWGGLETRLDTSK